MNIALIGCGYWGSKVARVFSQIEGIGLHSCCDLDESRLQSIRNDHPHIITTTDSSNILSNPIIDAVVIAVGVTCHYELGRQALLGNKHVLIEKPFTLKSGEAAALINMAKNRNRILMVDHTFEYSPAIREIRNIIRSGELGKIYYIKADWLNLGLLQPDVNVVFDLAAHVFSTINYVIGCSPTSIRAIGNGYIRDKFEEMANIVMQYRDGLIAFINVSWLEPCKVRTITIVGSKKMLQFDLLNETGQIRIYDRGVEISAIDDSISYRSGDVYAPAISLNEPLMEMGRHFVECIKENRKPLTGGEEGLAVIKLLELANESISRNGVEIRV
jgi:predicted dehydrogenase